MDGPIAPYDPLLKLPNINATPHVARVTDRSYADIADAVATNIERLRGGATAKPGRIAPCARLDDKSYAVADQWRAMRK